MRLWAAKSRKRINKYIPQKQNMSFTQNGCC